MFQHFHRLLITALLYRLLLLGLSRLLNILALVLKKIGIHTEYRQSNLELIYNPIIYINQAIS